MLRNCVSKLTYFKASIRNLHEEKPFSKAKSSFKVLTIEKVMQIECKHQFHLQRLPEFTHASAVLNTVKASYEDTFFEQGYGDLNST